MARRPCRVREPLWQPRRQVRGRTRSVGLEGRGWAYGRGATGLGHARAAHVAAIRTRGYRYVIHIPSVGREAARAGTVRADPTESRAAGWIEHRGTRHPYVSSIWQGIRSLSSEAVSSGPLPVSEPGGCPRIERGRAEPPRSGASRATGTAVVTSKYAPDEQAATGLKSERAETPGECGDWCVDPVYSGVYCIITS